MCDNNIFFPASISSADDLLDEVQNTNTEPLRFCHSLGLPKLRCDTIAKEKSGLWEQMQEVTAAWFDSQTNPTWGPVVKALKRMHKKGDAKKLADKYGVDYDNV